MTKEEHEIVRSFRNAVDLLLTSAGNPGRAAAVLADNTPGSPYHDLVMAKIEVDALLWDAPRASDSARNGGEMDKQALLAWIQALPDDIEALPFDLAEIQERRDDWTRQPGLTGGHIRRRV